MPDKDENLLEISMPNIGGEEKKPKKEKKVPVDAQIAALSETVAGLTKLMAEGAERETRHQTAMAQMMSSPAQVPVVEAKPEVVKLPDPVDDAEGHAKALVSLIEDTVGKALTTSSAVAQATTSAQSQVDTLWVSFKEDYEDLAKFPKLVEAAGRSISQGFETRGLDPHKARAADPKAFLRDVADIVKKDLVDIRGEKKEEEEKPNRTEGIGSGDGSPASVLDKSVTDKDEGSFVDELKDAQKVHGIF